MHSHLSKLRQPPSQLQHFPSQCLQPELNMQSMHHILKKQQAIQNQHQLLYQIEQEQNKNYNQQYEILILSLHSFQDIVILLLLVKNEKQHIKLLSMRKQEQETAIKLEMKLVYNNVLDINKNIQKQQSLLKTIGQYFFLLNRTSDNIPQQHLDLSQSLIEFIKMQIFCQERLVLADFSGFNAFVRTNIDTLVGIFAETGIISHQIKNNIILMELKEDQAEAMRQENFKTQSIQHITMGKDPLVKVTKVVYLHFDKVINFINTQYPINSITLIQENKNILLNNLNERTCKIKISMNIKDNISLKYLISFDSSQSLVQFLQIAYQFHLWVGIQYLQKPHQVSSQSIALRQVDKFTKRIQYYQHLHQQKQSDGKNCQSLQHFIPQDSISLDKINEILKKQDLLALKQIWLTVLKDKIEEICYNWQIYGRLYKQQLYTFTMIHVYKMNKMHHALKNTKRYNLNHSLYENIYPNLTQLIEILSKKLGIQAKLKEQQLETLKERLKIQQNIADKIFYYFMKEQQDKQLNLNIVLQRSMPMSEYIASCNHFHQRSQHWNHIFTSLQQIIHPPNKLRQSSFADIHYERLVQHRCLGCSTFFIQSQNIYDQLVNTHPVRVLGTVQKLRQSQTWLKDEICGLLNSGGGVILFDCTKINRQIRPIGILMNQKDKQQCEQRIYSYMNQFHPKLQVKSHILVNFVPIVNPKDQGYMSKYSGTEGILKNNYSYTKKKMFQARFVTRVRVVPADASTLYFWYVPSKQDQELRKYCTMLENSNILSKVTTRKMTKMIKQKMNQFFNQLERNLLCSPSILINHNCMQPEQGISLPDISRLQNRMKKSGNIEEQYNYLSLLISHHSYYPEIRKLLKKSRFNCDLRTVFQEIGFKTARNTGALYHNNKFEEVYREIKKQQYNFGSRQVLVINVTSYLKLELRNQQNPFTQKHFNKYYSQFSKKYSEESLKLFQFKLSPYKIEYYLLTQTKTSNLFMYYLLNQHEQKAVFKNPYLLDKLNTKERNERMILLYQQKGRNQILSQHNNWRNSQSSIVQIDDFNFDKQLNNCTTHDGCQQILNENWYEDWQQQFEQYHCWIDKDINLLK